MKEFASNPSFVEMMEGIKSAFGFEDMGLARAAGRESSARLAMVKERLRKKAADKGAANKPTTQVEARSLEQSEAAMAALLREESLRPSGNSVKKSQKKKPAGNGKK